MKTKSTIRTQWDNAKAVIAQVRAGEWEFKYNEFCGHSCTAHRKGREMWVGNGGWFLDINKKNVFGLILRHYVWIAAVREARDAADEAHHPTTEDVTD